MCDKCTLGAMYHVHPLIQINMEQDSLMFEVFDANRLVSGVGVVCVVCVGVFIRLVHYCLP